MTKLNLLWILIIILGCESTLSNGADKEELILKLYMNLPMTSDGYYVFDYPNDAPHTYTSVESISAPMERIYWGSPDSFYVEFMYQTFGEPIANYSTYASSDSTSKRIVYVYQPHINDTLSVIGCIYGDDEDYLCKQVSFIVTE